MRLTKTLLSYRDGYREMFFLGHICWGYIFGKATSYITSAKIQVQLILVCSVLPDIDLLLHIEHGGIMHSIAFWIVAFIPILIWIGPRRGLPYLVSVLQHPLFGDFIMAQYKILIPFSNNGYGLDLGLLSSISLSLEVMGFLAFIAFSYYAKDLLSLFSRDSKNILSLLPAAAMFVSCATALFMRAGINYGILSFEAIQGLFLLLLLCSFFSGALGQGSAFKSPRALMKLSSGENRA